MGWFFLLEIVVDNALLSQSKLTGTTEKLHSWYYAAPFVSNYVFSVIYNYILYFIYNCVTLRGRIKEAARTLRKQDPALPENRALNRCEACFNWV